MTMRIACLAAVVLLALCAALALAAPRSEQYFPFYHVRPPTNWVNDPNFPFRDARTKVVHLGMQYNTARDSNSWGNMAVWHAVSSDYVT